MRGSHDFTQLTNVPSLLSNNVSYNLLTGTPNLLSNVLGTTTFTSSANTSLLVKSTGNANTIEMALAKYATNFGTQVSAGDGVLHSSANLHLFSGFGTSALCISTANYVGIGGNSNPQYPLHINGTCVATTFAGNLGWGYLTSVSSLLSNSSVIGWSNIVNAPSYVGVSNTLLSVYSLKAPSNILRI
jgi:hypothetical protein